MIKKLLLLFILPGLLLQNACVTSPEKKGSLLAEQQIIQAEKYEKDDALYQAWYKYRTAKKLGAEKNDLDEKISALDKELKSKAEKYYQKGVRYFNRKQFRAARNQFVKALKILPVHQASIDYLKHKIPGLYSQYKVHKNDTPDKIASKIYRDSQKSVLIKHFYPDDSIKPGNSLKLPVIDQKSLLAHNASKIVPAKKTINENYEMLTETNDRKDNPDLKKAEKLVKQKKYHQALLLIQKILEKDDSNFEANELNSKVHYEMGKIQLQSKNFQRALELFDQIDPEYEDVDQLINKTSNQIVLIQQQETELKNQALYEQGLNLIKQQEYLQAQEVFLQLPLEYKDSAWQITRINNKIDSLAEDNYKKGVQFFVQDKLEKAIDYWQMTLKYNAQHVEAIKNLQKARSLLEKLEQY